MNATSRSATEPAHPEREVEMSRTRLREIADFAFDGDIAQAQIDVKQLFDVLRDVADRPGGIELAYSAEHGQIV